jgi:hypothetical protein
MSNDIKYKQVKVELNPKQTKLLKSRAKYKAFIGGRASGKSLAMGFEVKEIFENFPRATWVIAGLTYVQLDSVVIPSIRKALSKHEIFEYDPQVSPYGIYVIGIQPPKEWIKPDYQPGKGVYKYSITFINGCTFRLVSQDNKQTHRGLSIDGILCDESATMDYANFIQEVLLPALRSDSVATYRDHPWIYGFHHFSSASWTPGGNWIYDWEEKYKDEIIDRNKNYKAFGENWLSNNPPKHLFLESTFKDNIAFLPPGYGDRLKENMEPWKYAVEVLNERVRRLPNGYYASFGDHNLYSQMYDYDYNDKGILIYNTNDYIKEKKLEITLDFNADICWCLVCQETAKEFRVINSKFVKPDVTKKEQDTNLLIQLANWFIESYQDHPTKDVYVYGDPNGNSRSASTDKDNRTFFNRFCDELEKKNWKIYRKERSAYPPTKDRYDLVNTLLGGSNARAPRIRININTNKSFIIALQNTMVSTDKQYKKDKRSEQTARFREHATDPTDAFDYILYAKYSHLISRTRGYKYSK